jgi:hypothetical protein
MHIVFVEAAVGHILDQLGDQVNQITQNTRKQTKENNIG